MNSTAIDNARGPRFRIPSHRLFGVIEFDGESHGHLDFINKEVDGRWNELGGEDALVILIGCRPSFQPLGVRGDGV
jgi:hypothetical protein